MEVKILWSDLALSHLEDIFDYHKTVASASVAKILVKSIIETTLKLEINPLLGVKEPLLENRPFEYRFSESTVFVAAVFDARQNPEKLAKISG
jgi:plasmid stabilization system protein ParE